MENCALTNELKMLVAEVGKYIRPAKERTLFSLGGRGHYENPVSDLLAFFMNPAAEHGLGTMFLSAFMDCLPGDEFQDLPLEPLWISREEGTENRKRIDLVLRGTNWMMLIENKIYHWQANPFLDYQEHFTKLNGGTPPDMVVLSPDGNAKENEWMGVSYENYCKRLKEGLAKALFEGACSKWVVFARELILHLENELYNEAMDSKAIDFVEKNWNEINQARKLAEDYRAYLHQELKRQLVATLDDSNAWTKEDKWAIRCYGSRWGQANIAWWYDSEQTGQPIKLTVYVPNPDSRQLELGKMEFECRNMEPGWESGGRWIGWHGREGFQKREDAIIEFARLANVVEEMFKTADAPVVEKAERFGEKGAAAEPAIP